MGACGGEILIFSILFFWNFGQDCRVTPDNDKFLKHYEKFVIPVLDTGILPNVTDKYFENFEIFYVIVIGFRNEFSMTTIFNFSRFFTLQLSSFPLIFRLHLKIGK